MPASPLEFLAITEDGRTWPRIRDDRVSSEGALSEPPPTNLVTGGKVGVTMKVTIDLPEDVSAALKGAMG